MIQQKQKPQALDLDQRAILIRQLSFDRRTLDFADKDPAAFDDLYRNILVRSEPDKPKPFFMRLFSHGKH